MYFREPSPCQGREWFGTVAQKKETETKLETFRPALDKAFENLFIKKKKKKKKKALLGTILFWPLWARLDVPALRLHPEQLQDDALLRAPASWHNWPLCKVNAAEHFKTIFMKSCNTKHFRLLPFKSQHFIFSYFCSLLQHSGWQFASVKAGWKS